VSTAVTGTRTLETDAERRSAVPLLRESWTDASVEDGLAWTGAAVYHLFGRFDDELIGVAGARIDDFRHQTRDA
jgi:hypothetical protein